MTPGCGLTPMTYDEAAAMYREYRRSFSFIAAPYGVLKTVVLNQLGTLVASNPESYVVQKPVVSNPWPKRSRGRR